jgi:Tfp pilus assembly protein PilF
MKAIEIDGTLAEAHASLAVSLNYNYSWSTAEREFKKAIELKPSYATAHHWFALYLMYMARFDEAIEEMKRARELDPLSLAINRDLGTVLFYAGQYDQAIEALQKTIEMDPNFSLVHELLGRVYLRKAMYEKALEELEKEKSFRISWRPVLEALMGITYVKMGKRERARQVLNDLVEQSEHVYISPYWLAWVHFALEENDQGFECLEKAYQERDSWICEIKVEPFFECVRSDPRLISLLKKMGLNK